MCTPNIHFHNKISVNFFSRAVARASYGLINMFDSATLNEPSVFELLRVLL